MVRYQKKMTKFCVTYLHDPFQCYKCVPFMKSDGGEFEKTFYKFHPEKHETRHHISSRKPLSSNTGSDLGFKQPLSSEKPIKVLKGKASNHIQSERHGSLKVFPEKVCKQPKTAKKNSAQKTPTLKKSACNSVKKDHGDKVPGKGTLKRKRWFYEQLQLKNDNYEDDLFEDQQFCHFQSLLEDESDNAEQYEELKTPVFPFSLSPRATTPSPPYRDCYSPTQLRLSRKRGEEYQYRQMKKKKLHFLDSKKDEVLPQPDQEKRTESVLKTLTEVAKLLNTHQCENERTSDTEEDQYFSDVLKQT